MFLNALFEGAHKSATSDREHKWPPMYYILMPSEIGIFCFWGTVWRSLLCIMSYQAYIVRNIYLVPGDQGEFWLIKLKCVLHKYGSHNQIKLNDEMIIGQNNFMVTHNSASLYCDKICTYDNVIL